MVTSLTRWRNNKHSQMFKIYIYCLLTIFAFTTSPPTTTTSAQRIDGFVNVGQCYDALASADSDGDGKLTVQEFPTFLQQLGPPGFLDDVTGFGQLPLTLQTNFHLLACLCTQTGDDDCCVGANAHLDTSGTGRNERATAQEASYLYLVCSLTASSIERATDTDPPTRTPSISAVTPNPTPSPIQPSTPNPTISPVQDATPNPTKQPTRRPTLPPTTEPTKIPTDIPTPLPTATPTIPKVFITRIVPKAS